jgi:uncharacterized membrane protein YdbT with pleckstrin-like domain
MDDSARLALPAAVAWLSAIVWLRWARWPWLTLAALVLGHAYFGASATDLLGLFHREGRNHLDWLWGTWF